MKYKPERYGEEILFVDEKEVWGEKILKNMNLCGIRPTGKLHIGHYFSVIKPALEHGCTVLIATHHAPDATIENIDRLAWELRQYKVPESHIVRQDRIMDIGLYFRLLSLASWGDLNRMTQFKSAKSKTAHLFIYPILMAHDVHGWDEVYVGEDQAQHLEFARTLLAKYQKETKSKLIIPKAKIIGGRIMSLSDPTQKMSKSQPKGCLFLSDDAETIHRKMCKAVTTPEGLKNLKVLFEEFVGKKMPPKNEKMKELLADAVISRFVNQSAPL